MANIGSGPQRDQLETAEIGINEMSYLIKYYQ